MAITSGIGARAFIDEFDFSGNISQMTRMLMETGQQNTTTIQQLAMDRTATLRSGGIGFRSLFDDDGDSGTGPHDILAAMETVDRQVSYFHRATLGAPAWVTVSKQMSHGHDLRDGELVVDVDTVANGFGVELGHSLTTGLQTETTATTTTGFDDTETAADTNFGLQAFLHVITFAGTSVDIVIQDSDDDGGGDAYADVTGGSFTTVTGVGFERIASGRTQAVKRWMRLDLSGVFSDLDFAVAVVRNPVSVVF